MLQLAAHNGCRSMDLQSFVEARQPAAPMRTGHRGVYRGEVEQAQVVRLAQHPSEAMCSQHVGQVDGCARHCGDRYAAHRCDVIGVEAPHAVEADARRPCAGTSRRGHVDPPAPAGPSIPIVPRRRSGSRQTPAPRPWWRPTARHPAWDWGARPKIRRGAGDGAGRGLRDVRSRRPGCRGGPAARVTRRRAGSPRGGQAPHRGVGCLEPRMRFWDSPHPSKRRSEGSRPPPRAPRRRPGARPS